MDFLIHTAVCQSAQAVMIAQHCCRCEPDIEGEGRALMRPPSPMMHGVVMDRRNVVQGKVHFPIRCAPLRCPHVLPTLSWLGMATLL